MHTYRQGDEVYLFGFSRGAFTVLVLVEYLAMVRDGPAVTWLYPGVSFSPSQSDRHPWEDAR